MHFVSFIERNVTAEFFIYGMFLPFAYIPAILINHAGRYTLPYSKCGGGRRRRYGRHRCSRSTGAHLARYFSMLRTKSSIVNTSKGDYRNSHPIYNRSTALKRCFSPNPWLSTFFSCLSTIYMLLKRRSQQRCFSDQQRCFSANASHASQHCLSADDQVARMIKEKPSLALDLFLFECKLHWNSIPSPSPTSTAFSSKAIDSFLHSFSVIDHYRTIKSLLPSSQYKSIHPSSSQFQRILLEAKGLQTTIRQYGEVLPLSSPAIYVSENKGDLPIVIDTGASCTITPTLSDFTSMPTKSDTATLGSLTTVQTKVTGQGPIEWDIEDVNGVLKKLRTISYYVPQATIRLFSPQAYFKANPKGSLTLNINGIFLHMPCGTTLKFPIQPGSNLPIMLTRQALHRSRTKSCNFKPSHKSSLNTISNVLSFICSSTYDHFVHGTVFHLQHAGAMAAVVNDDAVLKQANSNLSPEQKELLLWHYRLGHIGIARVQTLLQKPRTNSLNDRLDRLISPSNNKSSH